MKAAMRIFQFVLFTAALVLLGRRVPTVSAQGPWPTCITSYDQTWDQVCASCCSKSSWVQYVDGVINANPGWVSMQDQYVDCGSTLPGGCSKACGVQDFPNAQENSSCCMPNGYGPCSSGMNCCSGFCDNNTSACVDCIPNGGQCNDYQNNGCCSGICDISQMACVSCIPSGDFSEDFWNCCSGWWADAYVCA